MNIFIGFMLTLVMSSNQTGNVRGLYIDVSDSYITTITATYQFQFNIHNIIKRSHKIFR